MLALVDCNNFYVSCERVFAPDKQNQPVVVLSNNDGCVISRSAEAKALGVKMGAPEFMIRNLIKTKNISFYSANFQLYGDMSRRVMQALRCFSPQVEVYSVDEAFINLKHLAQSDYQVLGESVCRRVSQWTGLPVTIGIAQSKTLCKIGSEYGKSHPTCNGVLVLPTGAALERLLGKTDVRKIWGVGRNLSDSLNRKGITTALQLRDADDQWILKHYSITMLKTVYELRGVPCFPFQSTTPPRQSILSSRSFGRGITSLSEVKQALSVYVSRAAEKLREDNLTASGMTVYIRPNKSQDPARLHHLSATISLPVPTDVTGELISYACQAIENVFESRAYHKAGVVLTGLMPKNETQLQFFDTLQRDKWEKVMAVMDEINTVSRKSTIHSARMGFDKHRSWKGKKQFASDPYTSYWGCLREVNL